MSVETDPPSSQPAPDAARARLRIPLFAAMLVAAVAAFFVQPRVIAMVRAESWPALALVVAPAAFAVVVVIAALDAWRPARARGGFRGPSVGLLMWAGAFPGLLLPNPVDEY